MTPPGSDCLYEVYVELYGYARRARERGLSPVKTGTPARDGRCVDVLFAAQLAVDDAAAGLPMRAKSQVCRIATTGRGCPRADAA